MLGENDVTEILKDFLIQNGIGVETAHFLNLGINLLVLAVLLIISYFFARKGVIQLFEKFTRKTATTFDDFLVQSNFPKYIGNILPLLLLIYTVPIILKDYPKALDIFGTLVDIYIVILVVLICRSFLRSSKGYLKTLERFK